VKRLSVKTGIRLSDKVEITEGLNENDKVVIKGFLGLSEGKKIKQVGANAVPAKRMNSQEESTKKKNIKKESMEKESG
jgi:hypothetical protein